MPPRAATSRGCEALSLARRAARVLRARREHLTRTQKQRAGDVAPWGTNAARLAEARRARTATMGTSGLLQGPPLAPSIARACRYVLSIVMLRSQRRYVRSWSMEAVALWTWRMWDSSSVQSQRGFRAPAQDVIYGRRRRRQSPPSFDRGAGPSPASRSFFVLTDATMHDHSSREPAPRGTRAITPEVHPATGACSDSRESRNPIHRVASGVVTQPSSVRRRVLIEAERSVRVAQLASMFEDSAEPRLERAGRWALGTELPQAEPRFVPPRATFLARCFCECGSSAHAELSVRAKHVERAITPHTRARLQRARNVARGGGPPCSPFRKLDCQSPQRPTPFEPRLRVSPQ